MGDRGDAVVRVEPVGGHGGEASMYLLNLREQGVHIGAQALHVCGHILGPADHLAAHRALNLKQILLRHRLLVAPQENLHHLVQAEPPGRLQVGLPEQLDKNVHVQVVRDCNHPGGLQRFQNVGVAQSAAELCHADVPITVQVQHAESVADGLVVGCVLILPLQDLVCLVGASHREHMLQTNTHHQILHDDGGDKNVRQEENPH
mmetsp:Transcript_23163/g.52368  ORF Transcript_23163/g.52368 Transcript_23163/m.52368 type:complete len:204 (+) Transcript_23163:552-1163(+)